MVFLVSSASCMPEPENCCAKTNINRQKGNYATSDLKSIFPAELFGIRTSPTEEYIPERGTWERRGK
jgi:hypothetical protein